MDVVGQIILAIGGLLLLSVLASRLTDRLGVPLLLIVLGLGMLLGEEGPGGIVFADFEIAFVFASLALTVILFDGGLRTPVSSFRAGLRPAVVLATIGVALTTTLTGLAVWFLFDLSVMEALLLGAIVGSTDAAAVFYLLNAHGLRLNERVRSTLEIESGSNDPMAIFLTLAFITAIQQDTGLAWQPFVFDLLWQLGLGGLLGAAAGWILAFLINRMYLTPSLYPVLALAGGVTTYGIAASIGSSGFLAAYIAGLVAGNTMARARHEISRFHDGMAWLAQVGLFLMLGLLVVPSELIGIALPALATAAVLIFIARPVAVGFCLLPFRFNLREQTFLGWVGLRGAVPIVLALLPLLAGVDEGRLLFNIAFFVVLVSLLVQGWTVAPAARWLGLNLPTRSEGRRIFEFDAPGLEGQELVVYRVLAGCRADGIAVAELALPPDARVIALVRGRGPVDSPSQEHMQEGDHVYLLTDPDQISGLEALFGTGRVEEASERAFFGPFVVRGSARVGALAELYDLDLPARTNPDDTVADLFRRRYGSAVTVGDRIDLGNADLVASDIAGDEVDHAGVRLHPR
jgi:potassium/hydrogen antiporter